MLRATEKNHQIINCLLTYMTKGNQDKDKRAHFFFLDRHSVTGTEESISDSMKRQFGYIIHRNNKP